MKTLLITGIGGDIAQAIAQIVRETYPNWRLIGMDIHERHAGRTAVDSVIVSPAASSPRYGMWLESTLDVHKVDLCLPTSETELAYLVSSKLMERQPKRFVMPNRSAVEVGGDKYLTARHLCAYGIAGPWTVVVKPTSPIPDLPCIFKARRSAGSKAVFVCRTPEDVSYFQNRYADAIFQELLLPDDREVTVAVYRNQQGHVAVLQLLRKLTGGFTSWAEVIDDPEITAQCKKLAESLDLRGSINVQLRQTEAGPRIFEINARFSSTVLIRHRMGYCDALWALEEAQGRAATFYTPPVGTVAVRVQDALVLR